MKCMIEIIIHTHVMGILYLETAYCKAFNENVQMVDKVRKQIAAEITQNPGNSIYNKHYFAWERIFKLLSLLFDSFNKFY